MTSSIIKDIEAIYENHECEINSLNRRIRHLEKEVEDNKIIEDVIEVSTNPILITRREDFLGEERETRTIRVEIEEEWFPYGVSPIMADRLVVIIDEYIKAINLKPGYLRVGIDQYHQGCGYIIEIYTHRSELDEVEKLFNKVTMDNVMSYSVNRLTKELRERYND